MSEGWGYYRCLTWVRARPLSQHAKDHLSLEEGEYWEIQVPETGAQWIIADEDFRVEYERMDGPR